MNSSRLPNKALLKVNDKPLIEYLINRLSNINDVSNCIATSNEHSDIGIKKYCEENDISYYRGSLENVGKRMLDAAKYYNADAFVRINGDSPLLDPQIVEKGISIYKNGNYDLVTNSFPRSRRVSKKMTHKM